ncbi:hypothetical protein [Halorussus ruber]|uniref:hypothetical protein n=1 Tax=Halorussus ruber TaxID=1126238 RepID=UPI0010930609|nr:hypothetical protein [Halorussus ruber]
MPRAGALKQILRSLTVAELRSVRREYCPRVTEYDGDKSAFVERIRRSLKRSMDDGECSYGDLVETIRDELSSDGPERVTTRIRHVLNEVEISSNAGRESSRSVREGWICSEIFQGLRYRLADRPYEIEQEATFGRSSVDLLVSHVREDRQYVVEVKLAGSYSSRERLLSQLRKYRKKVPNLKRSFVLMVAERERDLPENKESVAHVVTEAEGEPKTEVVLKPPSDLRY